MSKPTPPTYKTRNWASDNEALKRRGSLTIWFDLAMTLGGRADWQARPTKCHDAIAARCAAAIIPLPIRGWTDR